MAKEKVKTMTKKETRTTNAWLPFAAKEKVTKVAKEIIKYVKALQMVFSLLEEEKEKAMEKVEKGKHGKGSTIRISSLIRMV